jgi:MraZ protein
MEKVRRGEMDRNQMRALASNTIEVTIDAQGRINLEEKLREYAGLSLNSKVIVTGAFDRVEIWEPTRHERISQAGTEKIAGVGE